MATEGLRGIQAPQIRASVEEANTRVFPSCSLSMISPQIRASVEEANTSRVHRIYPRERCAANTRLRGGGEHQLPGQGPV